MAKMEAYEYERVEINARYRIPSSLHVIAYIFAIILFILIHYGRGLPFCDLSAESNVEPRES